MSNLQSLEQRMDRIDYQVISDDKDKRISDLEAKLAESEKKILELQEDSIRDNQIYNEELAEKEKEIEKLQHCNDRLAQGIYHSYGEHFILKVNQDKISFAVAELEKAKIEFETYYADNIWNYPQYLEDRIKLLKEEK